MKITTTISLLALSTFILIQPIAKAVETDIPLEISDEMALDAGMTPIELRPHQDSSINNLNAAGLTPIELLPFQKMQNIITNNLNVAGIERAVRSHRLIIAVNKKATGAGAQTLTMYENGTEVLSFSVSTGKEERVVSKSGRVYVSTTPEGYFRPTKVFRDYHSYTWDAPMPNAVFFIGGIAIHATGEQNYKLLGTRASGGCVRTKLAESKLIREKIMETGRGNDFKILSEGKGRNLISENTVKVDGVARLSGDPLNSKLDSWDTVIIVHQ